MAKLKGAPKSFTFEARSFLTYRCIEMTPQRNTCFSSSNWMGMALYSSMNVLFVG